MRRTHDAETHLNCDYVLYNLDDFKELRDRINNGTEASGTRFPNGTTGYAGKVFMMANDIDFNNYAWEGCGNFVSYQVSKKFLGTLDGNFHKITKFKTVNNTSNGYNSFFMTVGNTTVIKNLILAGTYSLTANTQHGIFISTGGTTFEKVVFELNITSKANMIHLVRGESSCSITDCYNFGNLSVSSSSANESGLFTVGGTILRCGNYGNIDYANTSSNNPVYFVKKRGNGNLIVRNCVNAGNFTKGDDKCIGIGYNANEITNTLVCGVIEVASTYSGTIGYTTPSTKSRNYYDSDKNTPSPNGYNGTAKTTAQLTDGSNLFNNTDDWVYEQGYYPRLNNWMKDDPRVKISA